eukprot:5861703-Pyramimonas_sp.AAC.1
MPLDPLLPPCRLLSGALTTQVGSLLTSELGKESSNRIEHVGVHEQVDHAAEAVGVRARDVLRHLKAMCSPTQLSSPERAARL